MIEESANEYGAGAAALESRSTDRNVYLAGNVAREFAREAELLSKRKGITVTEAAKSSALSGVMVRLLQAGLRTP
jgi:hypothetical protein